MSYTQNNPFSRKSSPLNKDDQWIQKATADIKKRGTEGVCTGDKFGSESCPPGSKRYNLAKTFKKMAKDRKGGPSRESSEEKYMPIEDDMHKRGEGDMGMSRKPYGGNKGDEKRSVRDYEGPSRKSSSPLNQEEWVEKGTGTGDRYPDPRKKTKPPKKQERRKDPNARIYDESSRDLKAPTGGPAKEGEPGAKADESSRDLKAPTGGPAKEGEPGAKAPSRKSSSPLNQGVTGFGRTGNAIMDARRTLHDMENYASDDYGYEQAPGYTGDIYSWNPQHVIDSGREDVRLKTIHRDLREGFGQDTQGHTEDIDRQTTALDEMGGPSRKSSSPLNNTGITGLNYSKELQYMPIEDDMHRGMSRQSSSPLNDNGYNHPNPNWNQKKHDRQVKRVTRKLKKGKGVKLEKFGPEVIMESMRNTEKKGN